MSASNAYNHYMFLDGFLPASGWDAANALKKYTPNFDVYGDDTYNDDWLADNRTPEMFTWGSVTARGVYFQAKLQMPNKTLNEDTGKDEVYVMVNNVRSNNVQRRF